MRRTACLLLLAVCGAGLAQEDSRTVFGPSNPDIELGVDALRAGDGENGVRLTLSGLNMASSRQERTVAYANLCAGYLLLEDFSEALSYCNRALSLNPRNWRALSNRALVLLKLERFDDASRDIQQAAALSPNATTVKEVRALLLDATDPVTPTVVIDDRRPVADGERR